MHGKHLSIWFISDSVDQISYADYSHDGSEDELWLIEKVAWDVSVAAVLDVVNLEEGEQPQKCTRYVNEDCLLEADC